MSSKPGWENTQHASASASDSNANWLIRTEPNRRDRLPQASPPTMAEA